MIRFLNVARQFNGRQGIASITFTIERGEFVLLSGPSGAGKTTILRLIYLDLFPDSGQIIIENQLLPSRRTRMIPWFRRRIGIVFAEARLLSDRSIFDNVALPLRIIGERGRRISRQVNRLLFRFGLKDRSRAFPAELSSGEQKKVAIARALSTRPYILLADEALSNIDPETSVEILEHLRQVNMEGTTILAATHIPQPFEGIARRTLHFRAGKLIS
ncbi:MAG: ATP-binding cassette domain-containing protein [bacterium]